MNPDLIRHKKYIQDIEIFAGPSILYPKEEYKAPNRLEKRKFGYAVKLGIVHPLSKKIELNTNLSFERKGIKRSSRSPGNMYRITGDLTNDYLTISLMPAYLIGNKARFRIGFGGYFGLLQRSNTTYFYDSSGIHKPYYSPTEGNYKKYDAGLSIGIGYCFPLSERKSISIQFLNSNGMVNVGGYPLPSILSMSKNNSFSLLVGISYLQ